MFRGITVVNLDEKGRFSMPTRHRHALQEANQTVVITIDTEAACLLLYPLREWEVIENKLEQLPSFDAAVRRVQRLLIGHATEVSLDTSGRVLLPQVLRDYAQLEKQIVLVGQGKKFEIWDEASWQQARTQWLDQTAQGAANWPDALSELAL